MRGWILARQPKAPTTHCTSYSTVTRLKVELSVQYWEDVSKPSGQRPLDWLLVSAVGVETACSVCICHLGPSRRLICVLDHPFSPLPLSPCPVCWEAVLMGWITRSPCPDFWLGLATGRRWQAGRGREGNSVRIFIP